MNGPSNNEGYVYYFEKPLGWLEHYYLNPIPQINWHSILL